jgi:hypothetical protein
MFTTTQIIAVVIVAIIGFIWICKADLEDDKRKMAKLERERLASLEKGDKEACEMFANACCDVFVKAITNVPKK